MIEFVTDTGLSGGWYDVCGGWYKTVDRDEVYDFSEPFLKTPLVSFFVSNTNADFDVTDLTGKKIGNIHLTLYFHCNC